MMRGSSEFEIVPSPDEMAILQASSLAEGKTRGVSGKSDAISEIESRLAFPDLYDVFESRAPSYPEWIDTLGNRWTDLKDSINKIGKRFNLR